MRIRRLAIAVLLGSLFLFACQVGNNPVGSTPDGPTAPTSLEPSGGASGLGEGSGDGRVRLRAELEPVFAIDASGNARSEDRAGTADDRFDSQVEVAKAHFSHVAIDAADGFADEVVRLVVRRGTTTIFSTRMRFSENRALDVTFEVDLRGTAAPELRASDVALVSINSRATLRGLFELD